MTTLPPAEHGVPALRVLVVDDEPLARLRLRGLVEGLAEPASRVVGEAADADAALDLLAGLSCDVVLLDIAMPGRDGLKLADELRRTAAPPQVVFVTAHAEHALRAFDLDATDYLTKPVRRDRLQAALRRALERRGAAAAAPTPVLVFSDRGRVLRVPLAELLYLKAELKYVTLCSTRGQWLLDESLGELEQRLGAGFLRVHRNAVVALSAVRGLEVQVGDDGERGWAVQLSSGHRLAVSRRQVTAVREWLAARPG